MNKKRLLFGLVFILIVIGIIFGTKIFNRDDNASATEIDVYFLNENASAIVAEKMNIACDENEDIIKCVIERLIDGSSDSKKKPIMSKETKLNSYEKQTDGLVVDFSEEFLSGDHTNNTLSAYAIVKTLCQLQGVTSVKVTVNSEELLGPDGSVIDFLSGEDINIEKDTDGTETKFITLYFANEKNEKLIRENRTVKITDSRPVEEYVVKELISGPANAKLQPVLAPDTAVISVETTDGTCFVNFASNFVSKNSGDSKKDNIVIYSIVNSLTSLEHINEVQFLVEGKKISEFGSRTINRNFYRNEDIIE